MKIFGFAVYTLTMDHHLIWDSTNVFIKIFVYLVFKKYDDYANITQTIFSEFYSCGRN